jgi:hypothetical protein
MTALWRTLITDLHGLEQPAPGFLSSSFLGWFTCLLIPLLHTYDHRQKSKFVRENYKRIQGYNVSLEGAARLKAQISETCATHCSRGCLFLGTISDVLIASVNNPFLVQDILSSGDRSNRKDIRQVIASEVLINLDITVAIQNLFSSIQSTFCSF